MHPHSPPLHIPPNSRQPSPLSFASQASERDDVSSSAMPTSPRTPALTLHSHPNNNNNSNSDRPFLSLPPANHVPLAESNHDDRPIVPLELLPDSLLCRSTFAALEHSAGTLKRLTKGVLSSTSAVLSLLEQLERAEDDLFVGLGELGRWLESGYGVKGEVWDADGGIRKVAKERRAREREELEVMVHHGLRAVKGEIKRQGLAGAGAHSKFEQTAKQYYQQTSAYLNPAAGPSSSPTVTSTSSSDLAQAARTAQFDLVRYNHHSTLLYAVPPSSVGGLDLLVGLYGWVGAQLGGAGGGTRGVLRQSTLDPMLAAEFAQKRAPGAVGGPGVPSTPPTPMGPDTPTQRGRQLAASETPVQILSRDNASARGSADALKRSLSLSLAHLAQVRGELLTGWAARDLHTTLLEDHARRAMELESSLPSLPAPTALPTTTEHVRGPTIPDENVQAPAAGAERKSGKMHKIHRSVGGKLRDFLTSSSSNASLATGSGKPRTDPSSAPTRSRASVDLSCHVLPHHTPLAPLDASISSMASTSTVPLETSAPRPGMRARHSVQLTRGEEYHSPFLMSDDEYPLGLARELELSPRSNVTMSPLEDTMVRLGGMAAASPNPGGVGGLDGAGDEDERRELVGRKKEGVLWGSGCWEGLDRGGGKSKWERFWVVLAHSKIYEYRDTGLGKPESAAAVIDLKFASVREGRGTGRRFVFEVVTPSQGRRLYQATSETEMRTWLYAICNAIESCINGTSTVRTFDTSKLRTVSGSLDDHALPVQRNARNDLGLPIPKYVSTPGARRSMPPPSRQEHAADSVHSGILPVARRSRKVSIRNRIIQSAEMASGKLSSVVSGASSSRQSSEVQRPSFLSSYSASSPSSSVHLSTTPAHGRSPGSSAPLSVPPPLQRADTSPSSGHTRPSDRMSWYESSADGEIEKRVLEMAGLGLGLSPETSNSNPSERRILSESTGLSPATAVDPTAGLPRSHSADTQLSAQALPHQLDMHALKRIADEPGNRRCADCGRGMKSSRWATLSLREVPMVMFLCIRCCGVHRGLGTHISKPRSVDLDNWSPDSIHLAQTWGNERANGIWERNKPPGLTPNDEDVAEYIKAKYVQGVWLSEEDKAAFGIWA